MELTATIKKGNENKVRLLFKEENGFAHKKEVGFAAFLDVLNSADIQKEEEFEQIRIPDGFYSGFQSSDGRSFKVLIKLPQGRRTIHYYGQPFEVPFPTLLFCIRGRRGRINCTKVFAYWEKEDLVYHYPFGNVHDNGIICWGGNVLQIVSDMKEAVDSVLSVFFLSDTNDDLFKETKVRSQRELLEILADKNVFPKKYLVGYGSNLNIKTLEKKFYSE